MKLQNICLTGLNFYSDPRQNALNCVHEHGILYGIGTCTLHAVAFPPLVCLLRSCYLTFSAHKLQDKHYEQTITRDEIEATARQEWSFTDRGSRRRRSEQTPSTAGGERSKASMERFLHTNASLLHLPATIRVEFSIIIDHRPAENLK